MKVTVFPHIMLCVVNKEISKGIADVFIFMTKKKTHNKPCVSTWRDSVYLPKTSTRNSWEMLLTR